MDKKTSEMFERRYVPVGTLRAKDAGGKTSIEGEAAVFNQLSDDLGGWREMIEPGFFSQVLADDVVALWNHNTDMPLARTSNETLKLAEKKTGLGVDYQPNETSWGRDSIIAIQRGDVHQMSFAFSVREGGDRWETLADGMIVRTLLSGGCKQLYDVSPVTYPAYPQTSVVARAKYEEVRAQARSNPLPDAQAGDGNSTNAEAERAQARLQLKRKLLDLAEKE